MRRTEGRRDTNISRYLRLCWSFTNWVKMCCIVVFQKRNRLAQTLCFRPYLPPSTFSMNRRFPVKEASLQLWFYLDQVLRSSFFLFHRYRQPTSYVFSEVFPILFHSHSFLSASQLYNRIKSFMWFYFGKNRMNPVEFEMKRIPKMYQVSGESEDRDSSFSFSSCDQRPESHRISQPFSNSFFWKSTGIEKASAGNEEWNDGWG